MKILIKFPTRERPEKFQRSLIQYVEKASNIQNIIFCITCDTDDVTMNNSNMIQFLDNYDNLYHFFGNNKTKIEAVNADISKIEDSFDIILLASDDMLPEKSGYDDIIIKKMQEYFPDGDGVLWFNDGNRADTLNTLCILGKKYYDRFNYIYYPEYKSFYCDNEFTEVSKILKKYKYFNDVIIKHHHYCNDNKLFDSLYKKNELNSYQDQVLFFERQRKNFNL